MELLCNYLYRNRNDTNGSMWWLSLEQWFPPVRGTGKGTTGGCSFTQPRILSPFLLTLVDGLCPPPIRAVAQPPSAGSQTHSKSLDILFSTDGWDGFLSINAMVRFWLGRWGRCSGEHVAKTAGTRSHGVWQPKGKDCRRCSSAARAARRAFSVVNCFQLPFRLTD